MNWDWTQFGIAASSVAMCFCIGASLAYAYIDDILPGIDNAVSEMRLIGILQ